MSKTFNIIIHPHWPTKFRAGMENTITFQLYPCWSTVASTVHTKYLSSLCVCMYEYGGDLFMESPRPPTNQSIPPRLLRYRPTDLTDTVRSLAKCWHDPKPPQTASNVPLATCWHNKMTKYDCLKHQQVKVWCWKMGGFIFIFVLFSCKLHFKPET